MFADRLLNVPEIAEVAPETREDLETALEAVMTANGFLAEDLDRVRQMFKAEDIGWFRFGDGNTEHGMTKEDLDDWSGQIREAIIGNTWIKAGIRLRNSYVLQGGGIHYENIPADSDGRKKTANVQAHIDNPINKAHFFGMGARKERESALYSDGNVFYLGDDETRTLDPVPLWEIDGDYRNPENDAQIWAYRRRWSYYPPGKSAPEERVAWYFTDTYKSKATTSDGKLVTTITHAGKAEKVDNGKTMFDGRVNTQIGWAYGVPDAVIALVWARIYRDFMTNGKIMTDALAQFAFQAVQETQKGSNNVGLQMAGVKRAGATVVTNSPNGLVPLSSAGKGYDFPSGVALLAAVATAIGVSVIHLSADPGTAGGSYGSASTLDLPTLLATNDRREWHIEFDLRVLHWMGANDAHAYFKPLTNPTDLLRLIQGFVALWNTGNYSSDEFRKMVDELLGNIPGQAPEGVMLPNNSNFTDTLTNDGQAPADTTSTKGKAATGQGKATKSGNSPKGNDLRTDTLANSLLEDKLDHVLERIEALMLLDRAA